MEEAVVDELMVLNELEELKSNFDEVEGKSKEKQEKLKNQIKEKENEISTLRTDIALKDLNLGVPSKSLSGGLFGFGSSSKGGGLPILPSLGEIFSENQDSEINDKILLEKLIKSQGKKNKSSSSSPPEEKK